MSPMAPSIGVNLRVTGHCNQGDRQYMEDVFSIAYQQTEDEKGLEYAFFGIFDGHGGSEAAQFAKQNLMEFVVNQKNFWSDDDELVLKAIREGFIATHQAMWRELDRWPRTVTGLPSTSGCTASVAFIRRGKIYIGHVGDSAIVLGSEHPSGESKRWLARPLTRDHKPESLEECTRITGCGGKVINKSGVSRVVWNRPRSGHQGPIRRSTQIVEVPFLAVARSLGDLWSYNSSRNEYVVSPEPDLHVLSLDVRVHRCLVLATDGLWNVLGAQWAIDSVAQSEAFSEHWLSTHAAANCSATERQWINPSKQLVDMALNRWKMRFLRADNTSVITVMLDPPGPPKHQLVCRKSSSCSARAPLNRHSMPPSPAYPGSPPQDYKVFTPEHASCAADSDAENRSCGERRPGPRSSAPRHRLAADRTPRTRRAALPRRRVLRSHNGPSPLIPTRVR